MKQFTYGNGLTHTLSQTNYLYLNGSLVAMREKLHGVGATVANISTPMHWARRWR